MKPIGIIGKSIIYLTDNNEIIEIPKFIKSRKFLEEL